jgi:hypothetical protein
MPLAGGGKKTVRVRVRLRVCQSVVCEAPKIVNHQGHGILAAALVASPLAVACRRLRAVPCTEWGLFTRSQTGPRLVPDCEHTGPRSAPVSSLLAGGPLCSRALWVAASCQLPAISSSSSSMMLLMIMPQPCLHSAFAPCPSGERLHALPWPFPPFPSHGRLLAMLIFS